MQGRDPPSSPPPFQLTRGPGPTATAAPRAAAAAAKWRKIDSAAAALTVRTHIVIAAYSICTLSGHAGVAFSAEVRCSYHRRSHVVLDQADESDRLCEAVGRLGTADWPAVSAAMGERFTPESCRSAWRVMLREARIARGDVMSPCTKVCKLDKESSTYCYVGADTTHADTQLSSPILNRILRLRRDFADSAGLDRRGVSVIWMQLLVGIFSTPQRRRLR